MSNKTLSDQLETPETMVPKVGETPETMVPNGWSKFDLLDVLSPDAVAALNRKSIELKANTAYRKAIKSAVGSMTLSDAGEYAVYLLAKTADDYIIKKRIDDAVDTFSMTVPNLLSKSSTNVKLAEHGIAEAIAGFAKVADAIEVLDKWYGSAAVNTSDKSGLLDCYQRAVGLIRAYFGAGSPLR